MEIKYNIDIDNNAIIVKLNRLTNQIYKLLPGREEGSLWEKPLGTIIEEFAGMERLFIGHQSILFKLLCKLEGLYTLQSDKDFFIYRSTVFECLNLVGELIKICQAKI